MPQSLHIEAVTPCSRPESFSRTSSRRVGDVCRRSRPSPPPLRPESRRTWSGRMRPVPRLHTHMLREAVPSGIRTQFREKPAPRCPKAGRHRCPSACRPKKRHALPMPLPSAVAKAPPSGRLASPARRLPNLSFQRRTNDARPNSLSRAQRNALRLLPFGDFSSQSGAVLRPGASLPEKRRPSCSPCPEKSLSAAAEAVFATDRLPVPISGKKPRTAPRNGLCRPPASEFPRSFRSHERSGLRGHPQIPRLHSVRMPARLLHSTRLLRSDSASAFLRSFHIPTRLLHPAQILPSGPGPNSATPLKRRSSETIPRSDAPAPTPFRSRAVAPRLPAPFVRFLKRKSPLERGPFS